jgi:hypothetical protein
MRPTRLGKVSLETRVLVLLFAGRIGELLSNNPPTSRRPRKRLNPHKLLGAIVLYGFAADDGIRVLNWLVRGLIHEVWK